jgi:hypothetical protein
MNDTNNIQNNLSDGVQKDEVAEQPDEVVVEIAGEELEQVAGGGDGTAVGVGHN